MPYERKGKCVHKKYSNGKISKKPVGCSDTVEKAKKYIQALYTSELNESLPNTLSPEENSKVKEFMKAFMDDKQSWIDQYGLEQANFVMYKTAVKKAKEKTTTMENSKLREMIKSALKNPKAADLNKDGKLSDYEEKRGAAIEKALTKEAYADLSPEERKKVGIQYDYEDIGQFYLEKIGKDSKLPDEALGKIGKKVVKQLYKNDLGAAYKDIVKEDINEDLDLGHQDNEPHMLKSDLYRIGKYAMELYKMVDGFEYKGEVDFPHWWQAKIIKSKDMLVSAKHYLDFELNEPQIDAMVDVASEEEAIEEIDRNDPVMMKMRASKMKANQPKKSINPDYAAAKNASKIDLLKKERAQLMRDMEQEAEPEGGPIADEYGAKLNRIDAAIAKLSGRKEMTYDQAIAEDKSLKKGDIVKFKDGSSIYILGPKGDGYDYKDGREKGHHPKGWFDMMISSGKAVIAENDSYVRVSEPKFIKDKNNPNFLYVNFKYDTGGGVLTALGKETMAGQIRRLSSAEAMKQATALAKDLEAKYNLEDIDVYDKENGVVQIFAVSDDFIDMNPNMLKKSKFKKHGEMSGFDMRGINEAKVEVDDKTEFKLDLKHLLDKHVVEQGYSLTKEHETDPNMELKVGDYQTQHFHMCPGAKSLYQDIENKVEDMGLAIRSAKLQDALFAMEESALENGANEADVFAAETIADQIMAMAAMMGLDKEHSYIQGHVDKIKGALDKGQVAEASKGALNYFNDLKYYYQKAFRYLDVEEREEYKQLAKDFFSNLQIDDKVRAVGLEENMSLDDQAKAYYLAKVKRGEIDTLPEDPKSSFLAQMTKDQMDHDKETLRRERGLEEKAAYIAETIKLGLMLNEELCDKGKRYIKARQAAGEKSSAYLSGRAVRVCKGQIEWPKKGKK